MFIFWFLVLRVILFRRAKDPRTAEVLLLGLSARTDCEPTSSASQGQRSHLAHETSGGALAAVTTRDFPDPEGRSLTARLVATALFFLRQHIVHIFNILEHHGSCNDYYYISELHNKLAQATALARCPSGAYKSSLQNSSNTQNKQKLFVGHTRSMITRNDTTKQEQHQGQHLLCHAVQHQHPSV